MKEATAGNATAKGLGLMRLRSRARRAMCNSTGFESLLWEGPSPRSQQLSFVDLIFAHPQRKKTIGGNSYDSGKGEVFELAAAFEYLLSGGGAVMQVSRADLDLGGWSCVLPSKEHAGFVSTPSKTRETATRNARHAFWWMPKGFWISGKWRNGGQGST